VTVTKYLKKQTKGGERSILALGFRGFSPLSTDSIALAGGKAEYHGSGSVRERKRKNGAGEMQGGREGGRKGERERESEKEREREI
jgi:hypothetical protein